MAKKTAKQSTNQEPLPDKFSVGIAVTPESLSKVLSEYEIDVGDYPHVDPNPDGTGTLMAFLTQPQIKQLQAAEFRVEVGENISELGRQRQSEVGKGDRFKGGRVGPRGLGFKPGSNPDTKEFSE